MVNSLPLRLLLISQMPIDPPLLKEEIADAAIGDLVLSQAR